MGLIYGKKANANGSKKLETTGNLSSFCECANGKGSSDTTVLTYNRRFCSLGYSLDMTMTFWQAGGKNGCAAGCGAQRVAFSFGEGGSLKG